MDEIESSTKSMRLRYSGVCRTCGCDLEAGVRAFYERASKTVRCLSCPALADEAVGDPPDGHADGRGDASVEAGVAGASARREHERRRRRREDRVRAAHPRLGGLILALSEEPQSTAAWKTGAVGEELLAKRLAELEADGAVLLHDRRVPRSRANIDHLVVTAGGVWVVDAKRYRGRPELRVEGGILRQRTEKLLVGRRDCTKLVEGVLGQTEVVSQVLHEAAPDVTVRGALAFVEAEWPLVGGAFTTRGVHVVWPKRLLRVIRATDGSADVPTVARMIAAALPPA